MPGLRNPNDDDREVLKRLSNLEKIVGEDRDTLNTLLRIIKGDQEINGVGLLERMKHVENLLQGLEGKMRGIVKEEVARLNGLRPDMVKDFKYLPLYQKAIVVGTLLAFFSLNMISILHSVFAWLDKFVK